MVTNGTIITSNVPSVPSLPMEVVNQAPKETKRMRDIKGTYSLIEQNQKLFFRLTVFQNGALKQIFVQMPIPHELHEMVIVCKRHCEANHMRFMGVEPAFITLPSFVQASDEVIET